MIDSSKNIFKCWALVPAAGYGRRLGGETPKQYQKIVGDPVIAHTLRALAGVNLITGIIVGLASNDRWWNDQLQEHSNFIGTYVGGSSRAETVLKGLERLERHVDYYDWILVHDAVRPCIRPVDIQRLIRERGDGRCGALLALPIPDTIKDCRNEGHVYGTVSRKNLWYAQTPQLFPYRELRSALEVSDLKRITDESSAMEAAGYAPRVVLGRADNLKVTAAEDLEFATAVLQARMKDGKE